MLMRTGSEPSTARSPLRMRLWLSVWGMIWALFGVVAFVATGRVEAGRRPAPSCWR